MKKILLLFALFPALLWAQKSVDTKQLSTEALDSLRDAAMKNGDLELAYNYAVEVAKRHQPEQNEAYLNALNVCARIAVNKGATDDAVAHFTTIDAFARAQPKAFPLAYAEAWNGWAIVQLNSGKTKESKETLQRNKAFMEETVGKNNVIYARMLELMSNISLSESHVLEMEVMLLEAKDIMEKIGETQHRYYGTILTSLGNYYRLESSYNQAEAILQQALLVAEQNSGKNSLAYAITQSSLAACYKMQHKFTRAEDLYKASMAVVAELVGEESAFYTGILADYGDMLSHSKRLTEAEGIYQKVLKYSKQEGFNDPRWPLANIYMEQGKMQQAKAYFDELMPTFNAQFSKETAVRALLIKDIAHWHIQRKEFEQAKQLVLQAFDANSAIIDETAQINDEFIKGLATTDNYCNESHLRILETLNRLLTQQSEVLQDREALRQSSLLHQSIFVFLQKMRDQAVWMEDKLSFINKNIEIAQCGINAALKLKNGTDTESLATILGIMEQNKMLLLGDVLKSRKAQHFGLLPLELAEQEEHLQKESDILRRELRGSADKKQQDSLQAALNSFSLRLKEFQNRLQKEHPDYFKFKYAQTTASAQDIQKVLPAKSVLLEYLIVDSTIYCLALTAQKFDFQLLPVLQADLGKRIKDLRRALSDYDFIKSSPKEAYTLYTESAHWLYQNLLASALQPLSDVEHVIIVPDGQLGNLPFETFLTEKPQGEVAYTELPYLLKKYRVGYSYSASLLAESANMKTSNNGKMLALAAAYSDAKPAEQRSAQLRNLRAVLSDLPFAQKEVQTLEQQFVGDFLYNDRATEAQFKQMAPQYGVLHLATHGLLDASQPILSAIALTENGDAKEDNFLQAWEISHLKLQADLVVLSACETGYGKFQQGEGIMSLARSFMYAGTPALVVSLWEVNDVSTSDIMGLFYQQLAQGKDKAEALRQAKLQYLNNAKGAAAHPAYWSPFVQLGNSQPIAIADKNAGGGGYWRWALGAGGALLAIAAFMRLRRK